MSTNPGLNCARCGGQLVQGPAGAYCTYCGLGTGTNGGPPIAQIARPANAAAILWKHPEAAIRIGMRLTCQPNEAAVFVSAGQLQGLLGPGTHVLDPSRIPFLHSLASGPMLNTEVYLVRSDPHQLVIGTRVGSVIDSRTQVAAALSIHATVVGRVLDPGRICAMDLGATVAEDFVRSVVGRQTRTCVARRLERGEPLRQILATAQAQALRDDVLRAVNEELAPAGLGLATIQPFAVAMDDESTARIADAERQLASAGSATQPGAPSMVHGAAIAIGSRVQAQWTNGRFYGARVVAAHGGVYQVAWDDGSSPSWVRPEQIRAEAAPVSPSSATGAITIGTHVQAQWTNGRYYGARVTAMQSGMYEVAWDDGSSNLWVRADQVRVDGAPNEGRSAQGGGGLFDSVLGAITTLAGMDYPSGKRVMARWSDGKYYPATVIQCDGLRYEVAWDDGTANRWVDAEHVQSM